jgi:hypothetical protein
MIKYYFLIYLLLPVNHFFELISAEGNETISYGRDFSSTGAYHVQADFKKGSTYPITTYPISVEIISINSKPV